MPTFLLLYTDQSTRQVLAQAGNFFKEHDVKLALADYDLKDNDKTLFHDCVQLPSYVKVDETVQVLERYCSEHKVDRIIPQTEYGLLPGALLNRKLRYRGISTEGALLCTNKWLSRKRLQSHDIPAPRFAIAQDVTGVSRFAKELGGYPVILKAVASTMGRNVRIIASEDELENEVAKIQSQIRTAPDVVRCQEFAKLSRLEMDCDPTKQFLVEEYVEKGRPVETDGLIFSDNIETFGVSEQVVSEPPHFYIEGYLFPSDLEGAENDNIEHVSRTALLALGLKETGFSVEMRESGGDCKVIEVNGRLGEDDGFPELFNAAIGAYPILLWIDYLTAGVPYEHLHPERRAAIAYINWYDNGVVKDVPAQELVEALQCDSLQIGLVVKSGVRMFAPPHPEVSPHLAYALATHPISSRSAYSEARAAVRQLSFRIDSQVS